MGGITGTLTDWIGSAGVYAIFALMLIDAVFPAGSEIVMLYAGALAAGAFPGHSVTLFGWEIQSTAWGFVVVALAGTLGYWVGSMLGWGIGLYGGRPLLERHGRWFHLTPDKLDRAERWFDRYEVWTVCIGRMIPLVRSFISIPAGVFGVRFGPYAILTLLGTIPWCFGLAGVGFAVGTGWESFHERFSWADYVVLALAVVGLFYVAFRVKRARSAPERSV